MGDKVTIPRSFADRIGAADVLPSLRRHTMNMYNGNMTTGILWPGVSAAGLHTTTIRPVNGMPLFARNVTVERVFMAVYSQTTDAATTVTRVDIMAGATTIARVGGRLWNATTLDPYVMSTTPDNANVSAAKPIRIICVRKLGLAKSASIVMRYRDALDS